MHLTKSDILQLTRIENWGLAVFINIILYLTTRALAINTSLQVFLLLVLCIPVTAWLVQLIRSWRGQSRYASMMLILLTGYFGMLIGVQIDYGRPGLLILASWCSSNNDPGLTYLWGKLAIAPWSHIGMLLGCNAGMLLVDCKTSSSLRDGIPLGMYLLLCNLGMMLGIIMIEYWSPGYSENLRILALLLVMQMLLAMLLGMLGVSWLMQRVRDQRGIDMVAINEVSK